MSTTTCWIEGRDAKSRYGLELERVDGLRDGAEVTLVQTKIPGRPGAILLQDPEVGPRTLALTAAIRGSSPADARAKRDRLFTILARQAITLRTADDATRELRCTVTRVTDTTPTPSFIARVLRVTIGAVALDPYWRDVDPTTIAGIGRVPVPCPLGSAPVRPVLTLTGAGSVVRVELRDAVGTLVTALELAGLVRGVPCVIDCDARTIRQGEVSMLPALLAGDFPVLDPSTQADADAAAWPTLSVTNGALAVTYRRAWL